jgi:amino acid adenylation domain-containing protein
MGHDVQRIVVPRDHVSTGELLTEGTERPNRDTTAEADSIQAFLAELARRDVRVSLDGEKLRINAPAGVLDAGLKAALASRKAELIEALRAAPAAQPPSRTEIRRVPRTAPLPISFAQQRLWFLDRLQQGSAHYNVTLPLRITGALDEAALTQALDALVRRHESLHTRIREEDGNPVAELMPELGSVVRTVDLSTLPAEAREAEARRLTVAHVQTPFDLTRGPLANFLLLRLSAEEHMLLLLMHHIASDGWSLSVAARELWALYDAALAGQPSPLAPLTVQYVDYAAWQREQMSSGLLARQLGYWQRELADAPAVLELPTDRPRPAMQSYRGARATRWMPTELLEAVKGYSRAQDVTLYMTLLGAWQVLLARYSGQDDVVVGSPMANRDRPELDGLIGCFVNNVVMRGRLDGNPTFRDYLQQVKATVLRTFDHRELPFDRLVEALRPQRTTSHSPIFQVLFTLHSFPMTQMRPSGLAVEPVDLSSYGLDMSRFDLALEMDEASEGGLRMSYEYATDLFDLSTIDRFHAHFLTLLREIVADADRPVRDLPLTTPAEEAALWQRVNATDVEHDRTQCIHDLVRATAERTPDAVAVQAEDESLTYAELERRANQLAHQLRAQGVRAGSLVGVCLDRTATLPVALLGVLKSGAAYVPVDPTHPAERLVYTLLDAQVACVVTEERFAPLVAEAKVPLVRVDADAAALAAQPTDAPEGGATPADLAYVIYTSGSTGRPKGVEVEHRNLVNFLRSMQQEPGITADDVLLAVTTPSFDIAGLEIFLPLVTGARTVIASRLDVLDGARLQALAVSSGATILQATPATWRLLVDAGWNGTPALVGLCGGEALPRDLARALVSRAKALWNMYGPTETTVWSTVHHVTEQHRGDIPIGHPIANTTVYVLDASGRPAPIGVAGELCIGGEGVARGYRQRAELTAEKFVTLTLPGHPEQRVYRTGDVVRLRGDLSLEYVGRRDHQVKVRGYRIELGEIEAVLAEHPSVRRATVIVREDVPGDQRLVAYVVPADGGTLAAEPLRTLLRSRLPEYMVPSAIVSLPALPLTPNGKIDRKALPAPAAAPTSSAPEPVMTETQRRVADIWRSVLRTERVGLYENFFDLGGHSLLVVKVHAALSKEFGVELTVVDLFQRTTVAAQADLLSDTSGRDAALQRAQARVARQALG